VDGSAILAAIEIWAWRDRQRSAVHAQLVEAWPELERALDGFCDGASVVRLAGAEAGLGSSLSRVVQDWAEAQKAAALARAEATLDESLGRSRWRWARAWADRDRGAAGRRAGRGADRGCGRGRAHRDRARHDDRHDPLRVQLGDGERAGAARRGAVAGALALSGASVASRSAA
jgi:hypothetical protein